ncbi:glycosyltransferase [Mechercharimyces sp. CAU 1602]|nr:glycosyltransferase [Mechercharimyces sp. CAU 1602]
MDRAIVHGMKELNIGVKTMLVNNDFSRTWISTINRWKPDMILVMLGWKLKAKHLRLLDKVSIPKAIWYTDDPYAIDRAVKTCRHFDAVFTIDSAAIPVYKERGCKHVYHLPLAAPHSFFTPRSVAAKYHSQVLLLGMSFDNRKDEIRRLMPLLRKYKTLLVGPGWDKVVRRRKGSPKVVNEWVSPLEAMRYYNGADIVLNIHRSSDDSFLKLNTLKVAAYTPNNRIFEVASCSSFQLTSYRPDLPKLYELPDEMVAYKEWEQLHDLIPYYIEHENERLQIKQKAYQRTLADHLYAHRLRNLLQRMKKISG